MALIAMHANCLKWDQFFSVLLFCFDFHVSSPFLLACVFPSCLTFPPQSPGLFYSKLIRGSSELICRNPWTQLFFSSVVNFPLLLFPLRFNTSTFMLLWFSLWRRQPRKCWINLLPSLSWSFTPIFALPPFLFFIHRSFYVTSCGFFWWLLAFYFVLGLWLRTITDAERKSEIVMFGWVVAVGSSSPPRLSLCLL